MLAHAAAGADASAADHSLLPLVAAFWKEFDLEGRRSKLDELALKIAEHQEQSVASRKQLAEATREFKRSSAASTDGQEAASTSGGNAAKLFAPLLKRYQGEIDELTRRAKHAEAAFLDLYQLLYEAPDPAPALLSALESASRLSELGAQAAKMAGELAEYKVESKAIKNQDLTIRKLEEQIRELSAQLEAKDADVAAAQQRAAAEADAALVAQMQAREAELSDALASAQANLATMQRLHTATQNQLFAMQARSEEEKAGVASELELATAELERAQERLVLLEREKAAVMEQKAAAESSSTAHSTAAGASDSTTHANPLFASSGSMEESLRQELAAQREVGAKLRLELASVRQELEEVHGDWGARMEALKGQLAATERHAVDLERELASRPTAAQVDELKQQIRILQAVGYGAVEGDDSSSPTHPSAVSQANGDAAGRAGSSSATSTSLEAMLLAKNRRLEHELTMGRLKVAEATQQLDSAQAQISELESQLQKQQALVERLEEDLLNSRQQPSISPAPLHPAGTGTGTGTPTGSSAWGEGGFGANSSGPEVDDSMVRVLSGQRHRLRQRCQELEEELARLRQELQAARSELAAARADNVALVERLRYVHGYRHQQRGQAAVDVEKGAAAEARWGKEYDEGINPFKQFQGQQREQKRKLMGVTDKAMYSMGTLVFQGPGARLLAFCYLLIMHLLVFFSLTHMTHRSSGAVMDHHEALLSTHRHDLTGMMHANGHTAAAAAAASPVLDVAAVGKAAQEAMRL